MAIKAFELLPNLKWVTYMPDPHLISFNFHPWVGFSTTLPLFLIPSVKFLHYTGHIFILNRLITNTVCSFINFFIWSILYPQSRFKNDPPIVLE